MRRIGIFGGTFNPIHLGHLIIAQEVLEQLGLDKIIFMPSFLPPHKRARKLANAEDRFRMVSLALNRNSYFEVSNWEIRQRKTSYTIDTLKYYKSKFGKKALLFFIIGSDSLKELKKWKDIQGILRLVKVVVVNRPGYPLNNLPKNFIKVLIPGIDISSSLIRRQLALKRNVDYFVTREVEAYIKKKRLYS